MLISEPTRFIAKAAFVRGKTDYDRTAMQQTLANGNLRFNTPEEADKARQKAQERAKRKTNPLELKQWIPANQKIEQHITN